MIVVVESGGANTASVVFALERLGAEVIISRDPKVIENASHVILPGVGAAETAMTYLANYNLIQTLKDLTQPVLGICLGMQLLFDHSAEGHVDCLGIIPGKVKKIIPQTDVSVPHMGWNTLELIKSTPLLKNITEHAYQYFVHSYMAPVTEHTCAVTVHGDRFAAVVQHENFFGAQFHPERSGAVGMKLLQNFLEL